MARDTKPNLSNEKFEQFSGETLSLSGNTEIYGNFQIKNVAALEINGSLKINDGTESDGYILTSDSSGNTSWQSTSGFTGTTDSGITGATNGLTKVGQDVILGGTLTSGTEINLDDNIFKIFNEIPPFDEGTGFNNYIYSVKIQSDNKILFGGSFTNYNGTTRNRIIRLNSGGDIDNTFNIGTGFNGTIHNIKTQSDDKILVGGEFTTYSGVTSNYIIRLNSDGSVDETFDIGTGFNNNGFVYNIALQDDNKILVGGEFTSYSGVTSNKIIRLNTDGSIDETFDIGTGFNNYMYNIKIQSDNKILIGGGFTSYSGVTSNRIIKLNSDGSIDGTFNIGTGFDNPVIVIEFQSDNKILVGGEFSTYSGATSNKIIRLNTDGSIDETFDIGTGFNNNVKDIEFQSDNKILVGGEFTTYSGATNNRIIRLNTGGSIDETFNIGTGFNSDVINIKIQSDNKILVGGNFTTYSGNTHNRIIKLNSDGSVDDITILNEFKYDNNTLSLPNLTTSGLTITDGTESDGYVLTSDGSGNTSWESTSGFTGVTSPLTTKGDLYTYSTVNARLPVGEEGQVLSVNSGETTGLKWLTSTGGIASGENITKEINQSTHGFILNNVIGWSGGTYNKAIADGTYDGEILGIVSEVIDTNNFKLTQAGYITGLTGLTTNSTYFLSDSELGLLTTTEPTTGGSISKSVLIAESTTTAWVLPYVGYVISTGATPPSFNSYSIVGNDTSTGFTINHNIGTRDVMVQVYENQSSYSTIITNVDRPNINDIYVTFTTAPATGEDYRILITS